MPFVNDTQIFKTRRVGKRSIAQTFNKARSEAVRQRMLEVINRHGKRAEKIAKSEGHSPYKTGRLVGTIQWEEVTEFSGNSATALLSADTPYARRQEFEHKTKRFYLKRALDAVIPDMTRDLRNRRALSNIMFGRQFKGLSPLSGF